jgi:hypothetical protein
MVFMVTELQLDEVIQIMQYISNELPDIGSTNTVMYIYIMMIMVERIPLEKYLTIKIFKLHQIVGDGVIWEDWVLYFQRKNQPICDTLHPDQLLWSAIILICLNFDMLFVVNNY